MNNKERFIAIEEKNQYGETIYKIKDSFKTMPTIYFLNKIDMYEFWNKLITNQIKIGPSNNKAALFHEKIEKEMEKLKKEVTSAIDKFFEEK